MYFKRFGFSRDAQTVIWFGTFLQFLDSGCGSRDVMLVKHPVPTVQEQKSGQCTRINRTQETEGQFLVQRGTSPMPEKRFFSPPLRSCSDWSGFAFVADLTDSGCSFSSKMSNNIRPSTSLRFRRRQRAGSELMNEPDGKPKLHQRVVRLKVQEGAFISNEVD